LAVRAQALGHEVKHFIVDDPKWRRIGENAVPRVRSIQPHHRWADVIFLTDNVKLMSALEACRADEGCKAVWIGPNKAHATWEHDRGLGQDLMVKYGVPVVPYRIFDTCEQAIAYVKKHDRRFVCKPFNSDDKALSYVSKTPEDLIYMLTRWDKLGKIKGKMLVQDFIPGIETAVGGWFDGESFVGGYHENFEFKKLMNGEIGPATGEQGTCLHVVSKSKLAEDVLLPFVPLLKANGYTGYFDVNTIIADDGTPYPLEFTVRPGWPTFNLQLSLMVGDFVTAFATARVPDFKKNTVCTGVVMTIPDYPYSHITRKEVTGIPVFGFDSENKHHHPAQMMKGAKGQWVTAGDYVCIVTGHGTTVRKSMASAYKNLKGLVLPNSPMYRTDIGARLEEQLPKLHRMRYVPMMTY